MCCIGKARGVDRPRLRRNGKATALAAEVADANVFCGSSAMRLLCPGVITVVLPYVLVLARDGAKMHRILFTSAFLVPFAEQGNGVLHDPPRSCAFEAQQPILVIALTLAAKFAKEFHPHGSTRHNSLLLGSGNVSDCGSFQLELVWLC